VFRTENIEQTDKWWNYVA